MLTFASGVLLVWISLGLSLSSTSLPNHLSAVQQSADAQVH